MEVLARMGRSRDGSRERRRRDRNPSRRSRSREHVRDGPARGGEHRHLAKLAELAGGRSRERDEKDRRSRDYPLREDRGKPSGLRDEEPLERKHPEPRPEVRVPEPDNPDDQDIRELQALRERKLVADSARLDEDAPPAGPEPAAYRAATPDARDATRPVPREELVPLQRRVSKKRGLCRFTIF